MKRFPIPVVLLVPVLFMLSGCAPGPNDAAAAATGEAAGFWLGLWHGLIVVITFVVSLFSDNVNVYEVHNNGGWYNFGYVLGLMCALGGGGKSANRRRKSED